MELGSPSFLIHSNSPQSKIASGLNRMNVGIQMPEAEAYPFNYSVTSIITAIVIGSNSDFIFCSNNVPFSETDLLIAVLKPAVLWSTITSAEFGIYDKVNPPTWNSSFHVSYGGFSDDGNARWASKTGTPEIQVIDRPYYMGQRLYITTYTRLQTGDIAVVNTGSKIVINNGGDDPIVDTISATNHPELIGIVFFIDLNIDARHWVAQAT